MRRLALFLCFLPAAALALVVLAECGVRALYAYAMRRTERFPLLYERVYWDVPPWVRYMSILYADRDLGLWMRPNTTRTYINLFGPIGDLRDVEHLFTALFPAVPAWTESRGVWHLATNSLGIRNDEVSAEKSPSTFRVAVLGDSWTVGINVEREETYPAELRRLLEHEFPGRRFEVINFGMIGATSGTGKRLLPRVLGLRPDAVVLAYAQNDEAHVRQETVRWEPFRPAPPTRWARLTGRLEVYKLLAYWRAHRPGAIAATVRRSVMSAGGGASNDPPAGCPNPRVATTRYRETIDALVGAFLGRRIDVVLLYNNVPEFTSHCTLRALADVAAARRVPLVDASALLADEARAVEGARERSLGLTPPAPSGDERPDAVTVVFRVDMSAVGKGRKPYVMGNRPGLAAFTPNLIDLFDDGTHGDQVANDGVWSRAFRFDRLGNVVYLYTDGDRADEWTGLESYRPRVFAVHPADVGKRVYLPVAEFGRHDLRSDGSHPDARGYASIGRAVFEALKDRPALRAYLGGRREGAVNVPATTPPGT